MWISNRKKKIGCRERYEDLLVDFEVREEVFSDKKCGLYSLGCDLGWVMYWIIDEGDWVKKIERNRTVRIRESEPPLER